MCVYSFYTINQNCNENNSLIKSEGVKRDKKSITMRVKESDHGSFNLQF